MRLFLMLMPLAVATAGAQTAEVRSFWNSSRHDIRSSVNHLHYQLLVSLPVGYSAKDTTTYPVLYVLDAPDNFRLVQAMTRFLGEGGATPSMIIVGVGYPDSSGGAQRRQLDLTPTPDRGTAAAPAGGAAAFLATFRRDFIPFVDTTYRTRPDRALLGHSYGGLFAVYALLKAPELFARYGILSPSTWWDDRRLMRESSPAGRSPVTTEARAFVAVGADEDVGMRDEADSVAALLKRTFDARLTVTIRRYPGNHITYLPEAVNASLKFLYPTPPCFDGPAPAGRSYSVLSVPDRTEIERVVRDGAEIAGSAFTVGGACFRYRLTADAGGRVVAARVEQDLGRPRTTSARVHGAGIHVTTTDPVQERAVEASGPTSLFALRFLGSVDPLVRLAPPRVGDSTRVQVSNFFRADTATAVITRVARDSVRVSHPNFEIRTHVSAKLDMLGGTTTLRAAGNVPARWVVVRRQ